jgi:replication-associated recombination protein RarA
VRRVQERLGSMVGMQDVKQQVNDLIFMAINDQHRREAGLPVEEKTMHMVFTGPPGTGKSTVARDVAELYHGLGLIPSAKIVETDREGLVGGYSGQTAIKTAKKFNEAKGGVLFVDEAYDLNRGDRDDFGQEAVTTLMKMMEDNRSDTVVILAGYGPQMKRLLKTNPGLASRLPTEIKFPAFSPRELVQVMDRRISEGGNTIAPEAKAHLEGAVQAIQGGNAREVRNLYGSIRRAQARRLGAASGGKQPSVEALRKITPEDVSAGVELYYGAQPTKGRLVAVK